MKLKKIGITNFRNIEHAELRPGERFNIIVGKNAQGKTNILESIYLLGTMKSFRLARNGDLIKTGSPHSLLVGQVERDGIMRRISLAVEPSGKKARVDDKAVTKPADFFGHLNMVVFSPDDNAMVKGLPDARRRYLDRAIFAGDVRYLTQHQEYYKILKNRNFLLKKGEKNGLDVWTESLAEAGARLISRRITYAGEISELLADFYATIAGRPEPAVVRYHCGTLAKSSPDPQVEDIRRELLRAFAKNTAEELRRGFTMVGPHRDDLEFSLKGRALKLHGSQGEQRSYVLALKMAEIEYIKKRHGNPPVLLLDDMTSELDRDRNHNFMQFLSGKDMQVFITTTSLDNFVLSESLHYLVFPVSGGKILL